MFLSLTSGDNQLVLANSSGSVQVVHWGAKISSDERWEPNWLGDIKAQNDSDITGPFGIWRENSRGHTGRPSLIAHRAGLGFSPKFAVVEFSQTGDVISVLGEDEAAQLEIRTVFTSVGNGLFRVGQTLKNLGGDGLVVNDLDCWLPLPPRAVESMDFAGKWGKERQPQRRDIQFGLWLREGREGRPGFDHSVAQLAMTRNSNFQTGEVWALGIEFSGNPRYGIEKNPTGATAMMAGTLLLPGEVILAQNESFEAPSVLAGYSAAGLDGITSVYHEWIRARVDHPTKVRPRPLTLNVWEAVYFDHRREKLDQLAEIAAEIGVERLVLDDGWFGARRDDTRGLGDWFVSKDAWPEGMSPFIEKVNSLGMEFGLWFEGEMVNPDSDLYRAHPDWILHVGDRVPPEGRNQQVLDFTNQEAFDFIYNSVSQILEDHNIAYIKWDHNRILVDPAHQNRPSVISQTKAIYRMFDMLRERFPGLEIESCSSGGGRIDLGMIQHAQRFWTSDMTEALERQQIQRYTQMVIPPEMLGTHVSSFTSHQTARSLHLNFRAITALFGHAGIEWDVTQATTEEREQLRHWADYYKAHRDFLHSGRYVRLPQPDDALFISGVVAHDKSRAILAYIAERTIDASIAPSFVIPGLDADRKYHVKAAFPTGVPNHAKLHAWAQGVTMSGAALANLGLLAPFIAPESGFIIEITAA
jgi:alpha-galactosidase